MTNQKRALLSVSDKTGILDLAKSLVSAGYELISTGGTATLLAENGLSVTHIEDVTHFPECIDGRLKTLHPNIFGGLLAVWDNPEHKNTMEAQNIFPIDILVVNLYPFRKTVDNPAHTLTNAIENIDIGGPSMIRAAAKNHKYVTVITNPLEYPELVRHLTDNTLDEQYRFRMAAKAFAYTAAYDAYIAEYLRQIIAPGTFPDTLTITFDKHETEMRYGENPHQQAAYYAWPQQGRDGECSPGSLPLISGGIESAKLLHGKPLSYNNVADAHATLALALEFDEPVCVAVKHGTPCGAAIGNTVLEAYTAAYDCDPTSIFGGIICVNRELDEATAKKMNETFLEVIIAPAYSADALKVLTKKKNLRLLELPNVQKVAMSHPEGSVAGLCPAERQGLGQSPIPSHPEGSVAGLCPAERQGLGQSPIPSHPEGSVAGLCPSERQGLGQSPIPSHPEGSVAGLCPSERRGLGQSPILSHPEGSVAGLCPSERRGLGQSPIIIELKSVGGGILLQESDSSNISDEPHQVVTTKQPEKLSDLIFAMKVVKHVKSNAIVVAKNGRTLGLGGGEVRRSWAAEAALTRAGEAARGAVLASDALFPFPDVVELCAKHGIAEIIQPGGSVNDQLSIDEANKHGIAMVFTGARHFKH